MLYTLVQADHIHSGSSVFCSPVHYKIQYIHQFLSKKRSLPRKSQIFPPNCNLYYTDCLTQCPTQQLQLPLGTPLGQLVVLSLEALCLYTIMYFAATDHETVIVRIGPPKSSELCFKIHFFLGFKYPDNLYLIIPDFNMQNTPSLYLILYC